jgi:hypothetical protein
MIIDVSEILVGEFAAVCGTFADRKRFSVSAQAVKEQVVLEVE